MDGDPALTRLFKVLALLTGLAPRPRRLLLTWHQQPAERPPWRDWNCFVVCGPNFLLLSGGETMLDGSIAPVRPLYGYWS
jgi:hypothetical protein